MAFSVQGKSAIVTGAGSGINLCFAELLLQNGCNVLIADLSLRPEAEVVLDKYSKISSSARAVFQKTDVSDWIQLETMFKVAEKEFGEIDIACPGAGIFEPSWSNFWTPPGTSKSRDSPSGSRYAIIDINLIHPIRTTQLAISHFLQRGKSRTPKHIIHISSIAAQLPTLVVPLYASTKHAISGFVRSLAGLDAELGIRVTAVAPGIVRTPIWDSHPIVNGEVDEWVTPEGVAEVMLGLIQQNQISESLGDKEGTGKMIPIQGGTILEVTKLKVRAVTTLNDPGFSGAGTTVSDIGKEQKEIFELLSQENWGIPEPEKKQNSTKTITRRWGSRIWHGKR